MKKTALVTILLLLYVSIAAAQTNIEIFDKYVEAARAEWGVPGLSITVVKDGKTIFTKGYGVRELGKNDPVDTDTLFGAMSTTKAMTVVALGMLVDEGKLSWDDKVLKYLPDFRLADSYVTADLRVRDLLTHNAGVGNADFLWVWTPGLSSADMLGRMQYARPAYPLRGGFVYQNVMYMVAGRVVEKVSGMSWERFVAERIFTPLGMKNTFSNYALSQNYANRSKAHYEVDGKIIVIPESVADTIAPAGAVWSTAGDIGKWVNFMLGNTTVGDKQLLKPATLKEILKPQAMVSAGGFYPTTALTKPHWTTYGLGWFQQDYRGEMIDFHTGSLAGRTAIIGMMPDKNVGVYIFGNLDHAELRHALMFKVFDLFGFGDNSRDWSKETKALYDGLKAEGKKQEDAEKAKRATNTHPSLALEAYAGKYTDPFYGSMEVTLVDGKLRLAVTKDLGGPLEHYQYDSFLLKWDRSWWGESAVTFELNSLTGEIDAMSIDGARLRHIH